MRSPTPAAVMCGTSVLFVLAFCPPSTILGAVDSATGEVRQPRNIYELVYAFQHTFAEILTGAELRQYNSQLPEQIRETNPELYSRISHDVKTWTAEWIRHVREAFPPIPEGRLARATGTAERVDSVLRSHFADRGWPYKRLEVVFLPPRVFLDERNRGSVTSGMFIPFYHEAFFASVDWPMPMEHVLVHESLHFNKAGRWLGRPLNEGVTETAAQDLVVRYGLLTKRDAARSKAYPGERKCVELLLGLIVKRAGCSPDEALEMLLKANLSGDQGEMNRVFGAEAWKRVIELSWRDDDFQTHRIRQALGE